MCLQVNGEQAIKMPEKGLKVKFNNFHKQLSVPTSERFRGNERYRLRYRD